MFLTQRPQPASELHVSFPAVPAGPGDAEQQGKLAEYHSSLMQLSWFHFNPLFSGVFSLGKIIYWKLKCGLLVLHWEVCFCLIIFLWDCIYGNRKKNVIKLVLLHFSKAFVFCIVLEYEEVAWGSEGLEPALPQHRDVWCAFSPSDPCRIFIACNWCISVAVREPSRHFLLHRSHWQSQLHSSSADLFWLWTALAIME